jgi:hypothetical protein
MRPANLEYLSQVFKSQTSCHTTEKLEPSKKAIIRISGREIKGVKSVITRSAFAEKILKHLSVKTKACIKDLLPFELYIYGRGPMSIALKFESGNASFGFVLEKSAKIVMS